MFVTNMQKHCNLFVALDGYISRLHICANHTNGERTRTYHITGVECCNSERIKNSKAFRLVKETFVKTFARKKDSGLPIKSLYVN